jgi:Na+/proline symporter/signal transduction histidine kinase/CheY-like chemotaxis protein
MLQGWSVVAVAFGYIGLLFLIASYGDRAPLHRSDRRPRMLIYPLSLAIYCTSWTFFGSVGFASRTGLEFLAIYVGPAAMIGLCYPLQLRIVRLAKAQNITSIADFIAARYGKHQAVAATVAVIAIVGTIPYIALQLKAVAGSLATILTHVETHTGLYQPTVGDLALFVALAMAAFAVLFGTRQVDATEHQDGLMLAVATESIVKLVAFITIGVFVTFFMYGGPSGLVAAALQRPDTAVLLTRIPPIEVCATMTALSFVAFVLLPRQFHVAVVENNGEAEIRRAAWLFPLYLVLINLFVVPVAIAGLLQFPHGAFDTDMFVLAIPLSAGSNLLTLLAFVGGLSAATAMVIVECVALAIMVSNDLVVPLMLQRREALLSRENAGALLLTVRRVAIFIILSLAYLYYRTSAQAQLASIGLLAFAAVAQLAPAFFGGLLWRRATARGAIAGMAAGILTWAYALVVPSFAGAGLIDHQLLNEGPWGLGLLRPQGLFGINLPPLVHGTLLSLLANLLCYVGFSLQRKPTPIEHLQADVFVPRARAPITPSLRLWRSAISVEDLASTVARYIGEERTRTAFEGFGSGRCANLEPKREADFHLLRHAEHLLASAIGTASARLVLSLLLRQRTVSRKAALRLLDDANAALQYNREILQTALDHVRQGIAVFDRGLNLICWNRRFGEILDLPPDLLRVGTGLEDVLRANEHGGAQSGALDLSLRERLAQFAGSEPVLARFGRGDLVIEIGSNRLPDGGLVTTLTDITASVAAAQALERANEGLERRVKERTEELTLLNEALARAKAEADRANLSKTHFLAAASHDILQPLNAARLYLTSLIERHGGGEDRALVANLDASLEAVEEILGVLLDISRLDAGAMKPEVSAFRIDELLRQLEVEFSPLAREKNLNLKFVFASVAVRSDRRLLRRLLENLVSNAIKYTPKGSVLIGCRRRGNRIRIDVLDTGLGIPHSKTKAVFREFHRLPRGAKVARGLGLGLSIVERIARVLNHPIELQSVAGRGSRFSVELPIGPALPAEMRQRELSGADASQRLDIAVLCIDNDSNILEGMQTLLGGWGCSVHKARDLNTAQQLIGQTKVRLDGLLVDYHLDRGNGLDAIKQLRWRLGDLPAILVTADRSPRLRASARNRHVQVLNKPVKPAALRALLLQWRVRRAAAAE